MYCMWPGQGRGYPIGADVRDLPSIDQPSSWRSWRSGVKTTLLLRWSA